MGELKKWLDQKWVRIGTDGKIKGPCGTSKDKRILIDAYLPQRLGVCLRANEPLQPRKRSEKAQKGKL